jgi:hypothetical protein
MPRAASDGRGPDAGARWPFSDPDLSRVPTPFGIDMDGGADDAGGAVPPPSAGSSTTRGGGLRFAGGPLGGPAGAGGGGRGLAPVCGTVAPLLPGDASSFAEGRSGSRGAALGLPGGGGRSLRGREAGG